MCAEVFPILLESSVAGGFEVAGKGGTFSEVAAGDVGEGEEIVPSAARVLNGFELGCDLCRRCAGVAWCCRTVGGSAAGCRGRGGGGGDLRDVAGELGDLSDGVEEAGFAGGEGASGGGEVAPVPVAGEGGELGREEGEAGGGSEGGEELLEGGGEPGLELAENFEKRGSFLTAAVPKGAGEMFCVSVQAVMMVPGVVGAVVEVGGGAAG